MRYWLLIIGILCFPCTAIELPEMGISADRTMSPKEEQKLGETFFRQLHRQMVVIDDAEINGYINSLGQRLASYSDNPQQYFHFFVVKESSINAFAVPGGFVGIHSGLILASYDESELASVLAHEIAHVTQRHIARTLEASQRMTLPALAALILAGIISTKNPEIGQAAVASIMAGNAQQQIDYTRLHEQEADRIGIQMLTGSGFDPQSMPNFFERLQAANRYDEGSVPDFLRTHPVTTERIAEARNRVEQLLRKKFNNENSPLYHLMKAKLLVLVEGPSSNLLKKLQDMLKEGRYRDERAIRYALVQTFLAMHQYENVKEHLDWLSKNDSDRVVYQLLKAQLFWEENHPRQAMEVYEQALRVYPKDPMLVLDYAEKLVQSNYFIKAKEILLDISPKSNSHYYQLLARVYQHTGFQTEAHLALAESAYLEGDTALAIDQLRQARQAKDLDRAMASRVEARYRELQQELLEEQTDLK